MPDFDKSKVTDEKGKLKTVYHGSPRGIPSKFSKENQSNPEWLMIGPGFYFSEKKDYAELSAYGAKQKLKSGVSEADAKKRIIESIVKEESAYGANASEIAAQIEAFINVNGISGIPDLYHTKKYGIDDLFEPIGPSVLRAHLAISNPFDADTSRFQGMSYKELVDKYGSKAEVQKVLQASGYDGMTHMNNEIEGDESIGQRHWVAFETDQIRSADASKQDLASSRSVLRTDSPSGSGASIADSPSDGASIASTPDKGFELAKPLGEVQTPAVDNAQSNAGGGQTADAIAPSASQSSGQKIPAKEYALDNPDVFESLVSAAKSGKTPQDMMAILPLEVRSHKKSIDYVKKLWSNHSTDKPTLPAIAKPSMAGHSPPAASQSPMPVASLANPVASQSANEPAIAHPSSQGTQTELFNQPTNTSLLMAGQVSQGGNISSGPGHEDLSLPASTVDNPQQTLLNPSGGAGNRKRQKNTMAPSASQSGSASASGGIANALAEPSGMADSLAQAGGSSGGETWQQELLDAILKLTEAIEELSGKTGKSDKQPGIQPDGSFVPSLARNAAAQGAGMLGGMVQNTVGNGGSSGDMAKTITDTLTRVAMQAAMAAL